MAGANTDDASSGDSRRHTTAYNPMLDRSGHDLVLSGLSESHKILTRGTHVGNLPRGFSGSLSILPMVREKRKHLET